MFVYDTINTRLIATKYKIHQTESKRKRRSTKEQANEIDRTALVE